jgi:phage virion morphogenesis protein
MQVGFVAEISPAVRKLQDVVEFSYGGDYELFDDIGAGLVSLVLLGFEDGKDPWGQPWEPLSPVTLALRRGSGAQILVDAGILRNSYTHTPRATEVEIGSMDKRARIHNLGGQAGRNRKVTIPARPQLPVTASGRASLPPTWESTVEEITDTYLGDRFDGP